MTSVVSTSEVQLRKSITTDKSFCYSELFLSIEYHVVSTLAGHSTCLDLYLVNFHTGQRGLICRENTVLHSLKNSDFYF